MLAVCQMSIDWFSGLVLIALIFAPLERVLGLHRDQKVFRRGWRNDAIYLLLNPQITILGLGLVIVAVIVMAGWLVPTPVRAAVASQPYWAQIVELMVLADIGSISLTEHFTRLNNMCALCPRGIAGSAATIAIASYSQQG